MCGKTGLREHVGRAHIHAVHGIETLGGQLQERPHEKDAGVIDQGVHVAEVVHSGRDALLNRFVLGHVAADRERIHTVAAQFLGHAVDRAGEFGIGDLFGAGRDGDVATLLGEFPSDEMTHTPRTARHNGHPAVEFPHDDPPFRGECGRGIRRLSNRPVRVKSGPGGG